MRRAIALAVLPLLSGCGLQGAIVPLAGSSTPITPQATLTLQIDQAHGVLTMGAQPAATMIVQGGTVVIPTTSPPVTTTPVVVTPTTPMPTPTPTLPAPVPAPKPVPTVP